MSEPRKLHIAFFPWLAFGHIIPQLELAKLIAEKGHKISFITTPRNIQCLPKIPTHLAPQINLVSLTLPQTENLPHNAESTMDLPTNKIPYLMIAYDGLQDSLIDFLQASTPDWIIYDYACYWLPSIVANLGISGAFFSIYGAWTLTFFGSSSAMINGDDQWTKPEQFVAPPKWIPFSSKVAFRLHEAKETLDKIEINKSTGVSDMFRAGTVMAGCDVIAIRGCMELEGEFLKLASELHGKPVFPIGVLPPSSVEDGGETEDDTWLKINSWLDKQKKETVVYIAFGSEAEISQEGINELALGLELSGLSFFWALRKQKNEVLIELPDGFEERVKGRGLVWTSWAPQHKILAHESVGGFLTHCGYGSIVEALHFGRPLILLPLSIEQGLTCRFFEDKKVGIEVKRDEKDGWFTKDSVAESVRLVMVENEGLVYRDNAKEMKKLFSDRELHGRYINHFVEFLVNHRVAYKNPID